MLILKIYILILCLIILPKRLKLKIFFKIIFIIFSSLSIPENVNNYIDFDYTLIIDKIDINVRFNENDTLDTNLELHEISKEANMPIIISGHSGSGPNVFFNDLDYLAINDEIKLIHNNIMKTYEIINITWFKKFSEIAINKDSNYLYLITCDKFDMSKQLIISAKLVQNEEI